MKIILAFLLMTTGALALDTPATTTPPAEPEKVCQTYTDVFGIIMSQVPDATVLEADPEHLLFHSPSRTNDFLAHFDPATGCLTTAGEVVPEVIS